MTWCLTYFVSSSPAIVNAPQKTKQTLKKYLSNIAFQTRLSLPQQLTPGTRNVEFEPDGRCRNSQHQRRRNAFKWSEPKSQNIDTTTTKQ